MSVEIRQATEQDAPVVLKMILALAEYERLTGIVATTEERVRETLFGPNRCAEALVASLDGEDVGFAVYFTNYSTFLGKPGLYLEDLFVKPEARGRGVGFALLKRLGRIACERGCGRMEWAVLNWNQLAIDFYKKLGAVPLDEWTTFRLTGQALERLGGA